MIQPPIFRLINRNIRVNMDPGNMIILVGIPGMYLIFFGFGFQSILSSFSQGSGGYLAFLTPGIMGFQAVMAGVVGGSMLWADRRYGMLAQLLVGPFSSLQYLLGIMFASMIFGLAGALLMLGGAYALIGSLSISMEGGFIMFGVVAEGSILFGSLMLLISAFVKSNNSYTGIEILVIFIVNFASTVFYPLSNSLPIAMKMLFMANPLTYVVNLTRDGFVGSVPTTDLFQLILLSVETIIMLGIAARAYVRSEVSFE